MNCDELLACPCCRKSSLIRDAGGYSCEPCGVAFRIRDGVPELLRPETEIVAKEADRAEFWNAGWKKRNSNLLSLNRDGILNERQVYHDYLAKEGFPSVANIRPEAVKGKTFLNIGCGGGHEGLLFAGYGTRYIGMDFSHNAARFTQELIGKANYDGTTFQAEAEALPFLDNSIDFVYSSGVLHHTPNTAEALKEVHRVLKPGGTAMIGLYPTYSVMFVWYRLHALVRGNISKRAMDNWLNANTEGDWQTEGRKNKWTKTYTKPQFLSLMTQAGFSDVSIKQSYLQVKTMPIVGKIVRALLPVKVGDIRVGRFGSMLITTSTKSP